MFQHKPVWMACIISSIVSFFTAIFFNIINGFDSSYLHWGIFKNTAGNISDKYETEITPAGATFSIWGCIYCYQMAWLSYGASTLWRTSDYGYLYCSPPFMDPKLYLIFTLNMALNISWLIMWDREYIAAACIVLVLMVLTLSICIGLSFHGIKLYDTYLLKENRKLEIILVIGLVENGLAMYGTWCYIAGVINFTVCLQYILHVSAHTSGLLAQAVLLCTQLAYVGLDLYLLEKQMRFLYTPYIVMIIALGGIIAKNCPSGGTTCILSMTLLALSVGLLLVKLTLSAKRQERRPLYSTNAEHQSLTGKH